MSDLDLDQLIHTADGRLVLEILQGYRLPIMIVIADKGEVMFWYPPSVLGNLTTDSERMLEWLRMLEEHARALQDTVQKQ